MQGKQVPRYMRAANAEQAEMFRRRTEAGDYDLLPNEVCWRDRAQMLEDHGYQLRTRLRPGWVPSWKDTDVVPLWCEDNLTSNKEKIVDAVRKRDGKDVVVMKVYRESLERDILHHLVDAQRSTGKDHHIVPLLDSFEDDREPDFVFMVMPLLQRYDNPQFEAVSEVVDLFKQLLEGLSFIHSKDVAHRDCSTGNIMMDAPSVFPKGVHPCDFTKDRGGVHGVKTIPRYKTLGRIRYYFIDFGISRLYEPGEAHLVVGDDGADQDIPEMSNEDEYDPFPADVFIIGNIFRKHFLPKYKNLEFLSTLVDAMTTEKPEDRPTAADALKKLKAITSSQGFFALRHRLIGVNSKESKPPMFENVGILLNVVLYPVKVAFGIPSQTIGVVRGLITSKTSKAKTT